MSKKILDQILDPDNTEPLVVYGENDEEVRMEQIAVVPLGDALFLIAKPLDNPDIAEDEALVFAVNTDETSDEILTVVEEELIIDCVFHHYYAMVEELYGDDDDLF